MGGGGRRISKPFSFQFCHSEYITFFFSLQEEYAEEHLAHAVNAPLETMRQTYESLPKDRPLLCYCRVGQVWHSVLDALLIHVHKNEDIG